MKTHANFLTNCPLRSGVIGEKGKEYSLSSPIVLIFFNELVVLIFFNELEREPTCFLN